MNAKVINKELEREHYITEDLNELIDFAKQEGIKFDEKKLDKELRLIKSVKEPAQQYKEAFKHNWTFKDMNKFTKTVKSIFANRRFKASDADNLTFIYSEHYDRVNIMMKPNNGLREYSRLMVLKNVKNRLDYEMGTLNVKAYFQLRSYIKNFGHEETEYKQKEMKRRLRNIHKRVDNIEFIDAVLELERGYKKAKKELVIN